MGTVHSFQAAATSPEYLRRRFDQAFPRSEDGQGGFQPLPQLLVSGGIFFPSFEAAGQIADNAIRDASLFWLSLSRQQLRFFGLIP